jgi:aryl-alcohol dehydrogenase-like predicted oxidoreductase
MRLAIGTANFGQAYGVANSSGRIPVHEMHDILNEASASGVRHLDTAIAYGDSEEVLGGAELKGWNVVTKIPPLPPEEKDAHRWVERLIDGSLERLNVNSLEGVLMHRPADLLEARGREIYKALQNCKTDGRVCKIGISIYDPSELDGVITEYPMDIVQAPYNVLDRRLVTSGWMQRLHADGIEIHARSAFLQGLLLMKKEDRAAKFNRWQSLWHEWHNWLTQNKVSALNACLGWVLASSEFSRIVIGVDSVRHLQEILAVRTKEFPELPASLMSSDLDLINPSRWSSL